MIKPRRADPGRLPGPGQIADLLFVLLSCALPLFLTHRGYVTLTGDKYGFLLASVGLCAALLAVWGVSARRRGTRLSPALSGRPRALAAADAFAAAFIAAALLSTLLADDPGLSLFGVYQRNDGLVTQGAYVAAYFILSRFYRPKKWHGTAFAAVTGVVCLYAVAQTLGLDPLSLFPFKTFLPASGIPYTTYTMPFLSTIGNINMLSTFGAVAAGVLGLMYITRGGAVWLAGGGFGFYTLLLARSDSGYVGLGLALVLLLPVLICQRDRLWRLAVLAFSWCCLLFVFRLHFSVYGLGEATIAALVKSPYALLAAAAGGLLIFLSLLLRRGFPSPRVMRRLGAGLLALALLGGLAAVELLGKSGPCLLWEAREMLHGNWNDRFGSSRVFIWKRALQAVGENPLLGTGPDSFFEALSPWQAEAYAATGIYFDKAHNEYLQILVCQGIIGLGCWLGLLASCAAGALRDLGERDRLLPLAGGGLAYLIQAFFNISTPITAPLLWVLLGLLAGQWWSQEAE